MYLGEQSVSSPQDSTFWPGGAFGGAMAVIFWSEPSATFDVDVFVLLESTGMLVSLDPIDAWARERGYPHGG